ncbi:AraC family transcriptional regulator [Lysobacter helvus]|uniref:AraC family transcriptional regulator n=2 Tax=Lysobacteraceae TaxID=32033 RepID=A0ABN6FRW0_9GAMM|nr:MULTISPECIES: AraC family transcriptional regulator [Lysobacter]BCT91650.1 AraC family transcriptional regulator [Lysobacter caseinilyticus]BCT94803.1 AraC family transcriptional regulator [Lysobacter helvus]
MPPPPSPAAQLGVRGFALRQQATSELAIAHLRPTIPEHDIHRHQHTDMHLVLLLAGDYVSDAAGMPAVCAEPALLFNPPGTEHRDRFRSRDGLFLTLTMPQAAFARLSDGVPVSDQAVRLPRPSLSRAMQLLREVWDWDDASPLAIESVFSELVIDAQRKPAAPGAEDKLQRVLDRLESDLAPPTLAELAAIADLHPVYLARAFRKRFGLAPSEYVRKRRLHRAVSEIARGRTLARTAAALGFVDESHLHRCFVAEFGMTPGAFRRLALGRTEVARIQDAGLAKR